MGLLGTLTLLVSGMTILIAGGEIMLRGASRLALALRIPPLIVGLTIVAICTSAPELALSISAALRGSADIAVGNVVGSNICNICLLLGLIAVLKPIQVSSVLVKREIPLMIAVMVFLYFFVVTGSIPNNVETTLFGWSIPNDIIGGKGGSLSILHGAILTGCMVIYLAWTVYELHRNKKVNENYIAGIEDGLSQNKVEDTTSNMSFGKIASLLGLIVLGLVLLVVGSNMLVFGGVDIAHRLGVSELVIGLTMLSIGTSLPELVICILAAAQGKPDIAVGNAIGSNLFNTLGVLGPTAMVSGIYSHQSLPVSPQVTLFDMPVMIVVSIFCLVICITGHRVSRGEGFFLLGCYGAYLTLLVCTS
ncbi:MAG: calcium/sodium antiporter [Thermoguttaceae bacterium]